MAVLNRFQEVREEAEYRAQRLQQACRKGYTVKVVPWNGATGYWYVEVRNPLGDLVIRVLDVDLGDD